MLLPSWQWHLSFIFSFPCSCRGRETHVCVVLSRLVVTFLISGWRSVTSSHTHIDAHTRKLMAGKDEINAKASKHLWLRKHEPPHTHTQQEVFLKEHRKWRVRLAHRWKVWCVRESSVGRSDSKPYKACVRAKFRINLVKIHFPDDCGSFISPCALDLGYMFGRGRRFHSPSPDFPLSPARVCF